MKYLLLILALPCFAATYYVDPATGSDVAAGTSFGAAWATTQKALDTAVADDEVRLCKTGTETTSVQIDADTNAGSSDAPIKFVSYNSTGSAPEIGYTIQATASITALLHISGTADVIRFNGVIFDANDNATYALYNNDDTVADPAFLSCEFKNATSHGVSLRGTDIWNFYNCHSYDNGGYGTSHSTANRGPFRWVGGSIHDNVSGGSLSNNSNEFIHVAIYDNGGDGVASGTSQTGTILMFCTVQGNAGDGIEYYNATNRYRYQLFGNSFSSNGGYGINIPTSDLDTFKIFDYNHTFDNTSGASNVTLPGTNQTGNPLFTSVVDGSEDFTPLSGSPLIGNGPGNLTLGAIGQTGAGGSTVIIIED